MYWIAYKFLTSVKILTRPVGTRLSDIKRLINVASETAGIHPIRIRQPDHFPNDKEHCIRVNNFSIALECHKGYWY